jgi:glucose/arabinose dehydrogenase
MFFAAAVAAAAFGQGVPAPLTIRLQPFLSGVSSPVFMTNAGDGTNRLFIVQQGGIIRVLQPGATTATDFLNITSRVLSGGERGLLGLAFHPDYETNRRFFVYYTRQGDGAIQIAEYQASAANPNVADTTEKIIITIPHPGASNHNGGSVLIGPDGYLYAGPGDGGSANDPPNNAQNINVLLGKVIRLDINNVPPGQVPAYNIPPDNPYVGRDGADEIYAIGMRNPYRMSFDRGGARQLYAADVGQGAREEVDIITNGANYGWRTYEGTLCTGLNPQGCAGGTNPIVHTPPLFEYNRTGGRCSITGGFVYRGTQNTLPVGAYIFSDYCSGEVMMYHNGQQVIIDNTSTQNVVGFGEDESGELYLIREGGPIVKIVRVQASADVDGDLRTDVSVYRPSNGNWYALHSSNGTVRQQQFGQAGDMPVPEDYDGDNITDIGLFRPSQGLWLYVRSSDNTVFSDDWGGNRDTPVPGDYDGDARADLAVFNPASGLWFIQRSSDRGLTTVQFGGEGDQPVVGDYDGDGRTDIALWRSSNGIWYRLDSLNGAFSATQWGTAGDIPAPGDFDGDGKLDISVFRPSNGIWYRRNSQTGTFTAVQWGVQGDIPVVGDYDGDSREDVAVWRPSSGIWYAQRSSNNSLFAVQWGAEGDIPLPTADRP